MPGLRITNKQVEIYMNKRKAEATQLLAAAKAGISERSGRAIEHGKRSARRKQREGKPTRKNPFEENWETDRVPALKKGIFSAKFILLELQKQYPDKFFDTMLRTLQRKMKTWKALNGPEKEVMFRQKHEPGKLGMSDFTHPKDIVITIKGKKLKHIYYHFRLPYSGYSFVKVFKGSGESFTMFSEGLQDALWEIGGVPEEHRTDSLSAAFKNLNSDETSEDLTNRYKDVSENYTMKPTRNNPGEGHENGAIESAHRHFKNRVRNNLLARGSYDFNSFEEFQSFIKDIVMQRNKEIFALFAIEKATLKPLPEARTIDYTDTVATVSNSSTIIIKKVTYTVPSQLIGETLCIKVYNDKLECFLGAQHAITLNKVIALKGKNGRNISYKHVIGWLVKKPGAFRGSVFRDDLLPNEDYKAIWQHVDNTMNAKESSKFIVDLLYLAATQNCQNEVAQEVIKQINSGKHLKIDELQNLFSSNKTTASTTNIQSPAFYDELIPNFQKGQ